MKRKKQPQCRDPQQKNANGCRYVAHYRVAQTAGNSSGVESGYTCMCNMLGGIARDALFQGKADARETYVGSDVRLRARKCLCRARLAPVRLARDAAGRDP